ncbi:glycosyltransferase family 2 protein [Ligilactobacillus salivarius]|uniref:glycosyltransferase family 2 protein n=1 Tax=Ligilactobacillus salivarius TaxID=1624 RepID=UPI0013684B97|nr:glycosyltransferase [Ligilactobacillus salivarius]MYZ78569.1 glycosyltransferase [Ligilactobacillus salivarius]
MTKISIIVPIYNVEKYLKRSLDSLVNQTLEDIEIILVDDGSTDNSHKIAEDYKENYSNVLLVTKENGGLSDARNFGLQYASGEYIAFIDSDDYVESQMFERMYNLSENGRKKIIESNFLWKFPDKNVKDVVKKYNSLNEYLVKGRVVAWNKIYKKSWLDTLDFKFPVGRLYEDQDFFFKMVANLQNIEEIAVDDHIGVHYVQRSNSISYNKSTRIRDIFWIYNDIIEYYRVHKVTCYKDEMEYRFTRNLLGNVLIRKVLKQKDRKLKRELLSEIKSYIDTNFPNWKRNKYLNERSKQNLYLKMVNSITYKLFYLY